MRSYHPFGRSRILLAMLALSLAFPLWADTDADVSQLQKKWAEVRYQLPESEREAAFEALAQSAEQLAAQRPNQVEAYIWQGIILSTYAGEAGGFSALGLVKKARTALEKAIALDATAMAGSAYTSLGALYYQVPGWPLSFGSDAKAREYLLKGLALDPDGIDANFFYADFLISMDEYTQAQKFLYKALGAPARLGRELADEGRREEIRQKLGLVRNELN